MSHHSALTRSLPPVRCTSDRSPRAVSLLIAIRTQHAGALKTLPIAGQGRARYRKLDPTDTLIHLSADDLCAVVDASSPPQCVAILQPLAIHGVTVSVTGQDALLAGLLKAISTATVATCSLEGRRAANEIRGMAARMSALATVAEGSFD